MKVPLTKSYRYQITKFIVAIGGMEEEEEVSAPTLKKETEVRKLRQIRKTRIFRMSMELSASLQCHCALNLCPPKSDSSPNQRGYNLRREDG